MTTAQYVMGAVVIMMILGGIANFFSMIVGENGLATIDITDKKVLKDIFYGGEPWVGAGRPVFLFIAT